jgi:hypothetical protein
MTDQIFIWHMQGSCSLLTEYSISVCRGQADNRPNIHSMYAEVRQITNWISYNWNDQIRWIGIGY